MKIELSCSKCGSSHFDYPFELTDDAPISCAQCGHGIGTVAELQQKLVRELAGSKAERST